MMRSLQYALEEALGSLWRGRQSALLSMATIVIATFVLGGFLIITVNLERMSDEWSRAAGLSVYLDDRATDPDRAAIERLLAPGEVVAAFEFVSKAEALKRFKAAFSDLATTVDTFDSNPLPASYEVRLQPSAAAGTGVEQLGTRLRQTPGVGDVRYDRDWINRLLSGIAFVRMFGLALSTVLTIAAALTVANVVRLALYARKDELAIMQLVGAPRAYIRGPFVMEGVLQGGLGALVAVGLLWVGFLAVSSRFLAPLASAFSLSSVRFLGPGGCLLLLVGGMMVGCLGGLVAASGRT
jgi:cell division transport system permease protein